MKYIYIIQIIFIWLLSGCVNSKVTSFTDPEYLSTKYHHPIVWAMTKPIDAQQGIENEIVNNFKKAGVTAIRGIDVFPPTKKLTEEAMKSALLKSEGDSLLIIKPKSATYQNLRTDVTLYGNALEKVWIATIETKSENLELTTTPTAELIYESLGEEIVKKLLHDGIIDSAEK